MVDFENLSIPRCKKFSGYKPCFPYKNCVEDGCQDLSSQLGQKILIINLDALGNVLSNTSLLPSIKRKYPTSTIYWLTLQNASPLLFNNHFIDKVFVWNDENRMILRNIEFDELMNADKSIYACAFANEIRAKRKLGFLLNEDGKIIPANKSAIYNYRMGIDDKLKFRENRRTGIDITHETFELDYKKDEYIFNFTDEEKFFIENYKSKIGYNPKLTYVGFNTGCSTLFPNKKMTIEQHIEIINRLVEVESIKIVLLGGKEDTERNEKIFNSFPDRVRNKIINTPTTEGIRHGACYMDLCDIVVSGDSFGMHLAIALKKYVVAWFGLSCWTEIELYGRGEKLFPTNLDCAPCWNKICPNNLECIDLIDLNKISELILKFEKQTELIQIQK